VGIAGVRPRAPESTARAGAAADPGNLVMMVIALAAWPVATPQLARQIMGDPADAAIRARYRADVVEAVRRIVERC
jgi:Tetracyclin repressor-like, C-terminal domain